MKSTSDGKQLVNASGSTTAIFALAGLFAWCTARAPCPRNQNTLAPCITGAGEKTASTSMPPVSSSPRTTRSTPRPMPHHCIPDGGCTCGTATTPTTTTPCAASLSLPPRVTVVGPSHKRMHRTPLLRLPRLDCFGQGQLARDCHALVLVSALALLFSGSPGACCLYSMFLFSLCFDGGEGTVLFRLVPPAPLPSI